MADAPQTTLQWSRWDAVVLIVAFGLPAAIGLIVLSGGADDVWKQVTSERPKLICQDVFWPPRCISWKEAFHERH